MALAYLYSIYMNLWVELDNCNLYLGYSAGLGPQVQFLPEGL
jgi:hypothetical protein